MSKCPFCQFDVDENALVCPKCGKAVISPHELGSSSENNDSISQGKNKYKRNKRAFISLILGGISFPPSVLYLALMIDANISGGASDFQGALCFPFIMILMTPVGLAGTVLGILGLVDLAKNKMEYGKGIAIAGIILGLPGSYIILSLIYFLLTRPPL